MWPDRVICSADEPFCSHTFYKKFLNLHFESRESFEHPTRNPPCINFIPFLITNNKSGSIFVTHNILTNIIYLNKASCARFATTKFSQVQASRSSKINSRESVQKKKDDEEKRKEEQENSSPKNDESRDV